MPTNSICNHFDEMLQKKKKMNIFRLIHIFELLSNRVLLHAFAVVVSS